MGQRQGAVHGLDEERLVIALRVGAGRAVPRVSDAVVPGQRVHRCLCEDVGNESGVFVEPHATAVADGDASSFLPAVLQCEQSEEHGLGDPFTVGSGDAEDTTLLMWNVVILGVGG